MQFVKRSGKNSADGCDITLACASVPKNLSRASQSWYSKFRYFFPKFGPALTTNTGEKLFENNMKTSEACEILFKNQKFAKLSRNHFGDFC